MGVTILPGCVQQAMWRRDRWLRGPGKQIRALCPSCGWEIFALLPRKEPPEPILAQLDCEDCGHAGLVRPVRVPKAFRG